MKEFFINGKPAEISDYADDELVRAVVISLFSCSRARDDDEVEGNRRNGFWGDDYDESGTETGSRLWLLSRQKIVPETVERCRAYANEALQWLVSDRVAESVTVSAERSGIDRIDLLVQVVRGKDVRQLRFANVWSKLNGL